jgi:hypothetical protein
MPADVLQLAATGHALPDIARLLSLNQDDAAQQLLAAVQRTLDASLSREQARAVEVAHLDLLRRAMSPLALRGDISATRMLLRISTQRALLLQLVEPFVPAPADDDEDAAEVSELERIRARRAARRPSAV